MKKILSMLALVLLATLSTGTAYAASEGVPWDKFPAKRVTDLAALQSGAKMFVNHCLNCHAAAYMRYNRLRDIGLTEQQIKDNLIFTGAKVGDTMQSALDPKDAKDWFGGLPPDLTLIARSRADAGKGSGADYLYTYLRAYVRDETKATGWNNLAFPGVGMPHVLHELQGTQRAVYVTEKDPHDANKTVQVFKGYELVSPGQMTPAQYNEAVADLVAYLQWMGEPNQGSRFQLGVIVLLFLCVFTVIAWRLNVAYWKVVT
jgi:ubiquinol-cytochrome c reductase cytochrome c1 subunit